MLDDLTNAEVAYLLDLVAAQMETRREADAAEFEFGVNLMDLHRKLGS